MINTKYSVIQNGIVYIDHGPVSMTLEARKNGCPFLEAAIVGAEAALAVFDDFTKYIDFLRKPVGVITSIPKNTPKTVRKITETVKLLGEGDFTSLAAVAGTTSDFAVEAMAAYGADYAIANNGGDIAWHISPGQKNFLNIGLISKIHSGKISHTLKIKKLSEVKGLATSGMGGRSLTRGIASAVTALAADSSKADAAATAIANACYCYDPAIVQCKAEEIDYDTDIPGLSVTKSIGTLSEKSAAIAASSGEKRAEQLIHKGMIFGAVIFVANEIRVVSPNASDVFFEVTELNNSY